METLAAGGCLLTDRLGPDSGLNTLLTEGVHYIGYSTAKEAASHIDRLLKSPDERMAVAQAGYQRFWSCFSPAVQGDILLEALAGLPVPETFASPL